MAEATVTTVPEPLVPHESFLREVIRVNFDKAVLLVLITLLHHWHADEHMQAAAIGGLIVLIQGQRFRFSINRG